MLVLVARDDGVEISGIAVDRHIQHVAAFVEDFLDALAVVHVGIQDRHARKPRDQALGGDRGVVQVAEAARGVAPGVVAGRAADRVGVAIAREQRVRPRDGALRRPVGGMPGMRAHRATAVGQVAGRLREHAAQRIRFTHEHVGHDLVAPILRQLLPVGMGFLQEAQVVQCMDGRDRARAAVGRRLHVEAQAAGGLRQRIQAGRHFLRGAHLAA
ncbi:hypothetical protein FQZ97_728420 [compost metagenome]